MNWKALLLAPAMMLASGQASANVIWSGVDWNPYAGAGLAAPGDLVVTPVGGSYGAAHYNTPVAFRAASGQRIDVGFVDALGGSQVQLWIEDEHYGVGLLPDGNGAWTQFGAWASEANYMIYWWDYDTYLADNTMGWGWIDTGVARSAGAHDMSVAMRADGMIDYWLDGALVVSTDLITPAYFGDVYLAARYADGIFTDYQTSTGYIGAVPAPAPLLLIGVGLLVCGVAGRRRNAS